MAGGNFRQAGNGPVCLVRVILRRLEGSRFSEVLPGWAGRTVVILGGGPSLTLEQVEIACGARQEGGCSVVAVNDAYLVAPWADALYAADSHWWRDHAAGIAKPAISLTAEQVHERFNAFAGVRCSIQNSGANITDERVHIVRNLTHPRHGNALSDDPQYLATGRNSCYQALNLAILAGAKTVILLGCDGRPAADGRTHFSGGHRRPTPEAAYAEYRRAWSEAVPAIKAAGVRVLNCSPNSAVDAFPKMALEDALCAIA